MVRVEKIRVFTKESRKRAIKVRVKNVSFSSGDNKSIIKREVRKVNNLESKIDNILKKN